MHPDSVPCLQCYAPTGMPQLDVSTIPPGCVATLSVVCPACNQKRKIMPYPLADYWKGDR